jgi:hypothetical protein
LAEDTFAQSSTVNGAALVISRRLKHAEISPTLRSVELSVCFTPQQVINGYNATLRSKLMLKITLLSQVAPQQCYSVHSQEDRRLIAAMTNTVRNFFSFFSLSLSHLSCLLFLIFYLLVSPYHTSCGKLSIYYPFFIIIISFLFIPICILSAFAYEYFGSSPLPKGLDFG